MSNLISPLAEILVRLFDLALRLYPDEIRRQYAAEMQAIFRLKVADAARQGAWRLFILAFREARDLPLAVRSAHVHDEGGHMRLLFPSTSDRVPWLTALLSLLPFFIDAMLRIVLLYQPGWVPEVNSPAVFWLLLLSLLMVTAGLGMGIANKFPRWAYPYPIFLAFSLYTLLLYSDYVYQWEVTIRNSFVWYLAAILIVLWLPPFRSFYRRIPQDWTLLSYGLYGFVLFLLSMIDKDEVPQLSLQAVLPTLVVLGCALAHLRIRSAPRRMAVLLAGTFAGLTIMLIPVFRGMSATLIGFAIVLFMLLSYAVILAAILLAPGIVSMAIRSWRAAR